MMQSSTLRRSTGGRPVRLRGMSASMRGLISRHSSSSTLQMVGILPFCFAILALLSLDHERIIGIEGRFEIVSKRAVVSKAWRSSLPGRRGNGIENSTHTDESGHV